MEEILQKVADTVTDKPVTISVDIKAQGRTHALLQRFGLKPKKRVFEVTGIAYGNLVRISGVLCGIDKELKDLATDVYQSVKDYGPLLVSVVAIGLHNKKSDPPQSLYRFIEENMTSKELMGVLAVILKQMNVTGFISTIILTKGLNLLEMSQQLTGSSIAPGTLSQAS